MLLLIESRVVPTESVVTPIDTVLKLRRLEGSAALPVSKKCGRSHPDTQPGYVTSSRCQRFPALPAVR